MVAQGLCPEIDSKFQTSKFSTLQTSSDSTHLATLPLFQAVCLGCVLFSCRQWVHCKAVGAKEGPPLHSFVRWFGAPQSFSSHNWSRMQQRYAIESETQQLYSKQQLQTLQEKGMVLHLLSHTDRAPKSCVRNPVNCLLSTRWLGSILLSWTRLSDPVFTAPRSFLSPNSPTIRNNRKWNSQKMSEGSCSIFWVYVLLPRLSLSLPQLLALCHGPLCNCIYTRTQWLQ